MSNTALTPEQTFQENISARIRESIGDLIPDAVLKSMLETQIRKQFFDKRKVLSDSGYREVEKPSLLEEIVTTQVRASIDTHVQAYMVAHMDEVAKLIAAELVAHAPDVIGAYVARVLAGAAEASSYSIQNAVRERLMSGQVR